MKKRCYSLDEHASIYKSLILLYGMKTDAATDLVYRLNTANLDTMRGLCGMKPRESRPLRFYVEINRRGAPFRTPRELAEALEGLLHNMLSGYLTDKQRAAISYAQEIVDDIYNRMEDTEDILIDALLRALFKGGL